MILYGTHRCPDCEEAERKLKAAGIQYEYVNIFASTANIKAFLKLRDARQEFNAVKEAGGIGVPCFYLEEKDQVTLDIEEILKYNNEN